MRPLELKSPCLRGADIAEVQRALGLTGDDVDGVYGPDTARAVEDWKWRIGYPEDRITSRLALRGIAWLLEQEPLPPEFDARARERLDKPRPLNGLARPLATSLGFSSEFALADGEGAPDRNGVKHHAGKDWFAPGGSPVRAPVAGEIVEVRPSRGNTGQIFGGTVKVRADEDGKVWVFRHVEPRCRLGARVKPGAAVAAVTAWRDGSSHAHIEVWKTFDGGYKFENMIDPMELLAKA